MTAADDPTRHPPGLALATAARDDGVLVVSFTGELDLSTVERARAAVGAACDRRPPALHLDLTALAFIDSVGLQVLVEADRRATRDGLTLTISEGARPVQRILALSGLDGVLPVVR